MTIDLVQQAANYKQLKKGANEEHLHLSHAPPSHCVNKYAGTERYFTRDHLGISKNFGGAQEMMEVQEEVVFSI